MDEENEESSVFYEVMQALSLGWIKTYKALVDGMAEDANVFAGEHAIDDDVTIFAIKVLEPEDEENEDEPEQDESLQANDAASETGALSNGGAA